MLMLMAGDAGGRPLQKHTCQSNARIVGATGITLHSGRQRADQRRGMGHIRLRIVELVDFRLEECEMRQGLDSSNVVGTESLSLPGDFGPASMSGNDVVFALRIGCGVDVSAPQHIVSAR